jgi:DNA-binding PadR family transcriptional regulator
MGRSLGKGTVAVLTALRHRVTYGLDIVAETGLLPGTVYTTLRRLEKRGFVEGRWEDPEVAEADRRPRRRYYALTAQGEEALDEARSRRDLAPLEGGERVSTSGGSA